MSYNLVAQDGGAGGVGDKGAFKIPDLLNAEVITDQQDRDFSLAANLGNWIFYNDSTDSTLAYDNTDIGGADNKQALITVDETTDPCSYAYGQISQAAMSLSANTLYRISAMVYVPAANTQKTVSFFVHASFAGSTNSNINTTLVGDTWTEIVNYIHLDADVVGVFLLGFSASNNPSDGDLLYFDDISIKPVDISWVPYGTNTLSIEDGALKLLGDGSNSSGGFLYLSLTKSNDIIVDLTIGKKYKVIFDAKTGPLHTVNPRIWDGANWLNIGAITTTYVTYETVFTAYHVTNCLLQLTHVGGTEYIYIDNFKVQSYTGSKGSMGMSIGMGMEIK